MARIPLVGPSAAARSLNSDAERTINLYACLTDGGGQSKNPAGYLQKRPGLRPYQFTADVFAGMALAAGPVRGLFAQDGRAWGVGGTSCEELYQSGLTSVLGTVADDTLPAVFATNGSGGFQVMLTSGGLGYILDTTSTPAGFALITAGDFPSAVVSCAFLDGYFIVLERGTSKFYLSTLEDGTAWDALDVNQVSQYSDVVQQIMVTHEELWVFGSKHIQPWQDTGNADIPFQPVPGTMIEHGIHAPWSVVNLDNTLFWMGRDEQGALIVYRANGYTPTRISTFALETALNRAENVADAIGWAFQLEGHTFYLLYCPTMETTWVYDISTGLWDEWALWIPTTEEWRPFLGRCHAYAFNSNVHLIGDRQSPTIYQAKFPELNTGNAHAYDQIYVGTGI